MSQPGGNQRHWESEWERDHRNPVNRALHFYVGMPLVGLGLFLLVFRFDWRGVLCILAGYVVMFAGHFVFEGNAPTILRDPRGVWGAAVYVVERIVARPWRAAARVLGAHTASSVASPAPAREPALATKDPAP